MPPRRFQFRLKSLMVLVVVVALGCAFPDFSIGLIYGLTGWVILLPFMMALLLIGAVLMMAFYLFVAAPGFFLVHWIEKRKDAAGRQAIEPDTHDENIGVLEREASGG